MTTQELIDSMAATYAAYGKGEAEPFFDLFAEDGVIRFVGPPEIYPFATPRRGPEGAREAVSLIVKDYEWLSFRNLELIAEDDCVFALNAGRLRHRASGREAVLHLGDLTRFEGGRIVEFVEFFDSAGLRDWGNGGCLPGVCNLDPGKKAAFAPSEDAMRNKEALAAAYAGYARADAGPLIAMLAEDVCYNAVVDRQHLGFAGPSHGRDAFIETLGRISEGFELQKYEVLKMIAQDDLVAVHADVAYAHRVTGREGGSEKIDLFRLFDGRIVEFNEFFDTHAARALQEP